MTPPAESGAADSEPIALRDYHPDDINRTIDEHQRKAVDSLVASGTLSTEGPLTPDDIRTMLFIALSSEQLRSILHVARDEEPIVRSERRDPSPLLVETSPTDDAHPDDRLPRWQVVDDPGLDDPASAAATDPGDTEPGDDDPPSTGYLYATGGN